jgi:hypothetical protein
MQYIEHALKLEFRVIALLLKVNFMCTSERYERLHKLGHLRRIHVFAERLQDMHDANFTGKKASQSQVHGWYVLHRDYCGPATINPVSIHAPDVRMPWLSGRFCEQCRKPYRAPRGDSKFCSDACRQRAYRERPKRNASVTRDTDDEPRRPDVGNARGDETMSSEERKEGMYWTNPDGTAGYQPFTDDNFEDCQYCGRPHGDEVEIVQGKDRAIVYLHAECEAAYRQSWGD